MTADMYETPRHERHYQNALCAIRRYFETEPAAETVEAADFDALFALIENYEAIHYNVPRAASPAAFAVVGRSLSEI